MFAELRQPLRSLLRSADSLRQQEGILFRYTIGDNLHPDELSIGAKFQLSWSLFKFKETSRLLSYLRSSSSGSLTL